MWKFSKKKTEPKTEIEILTDKVDQTVAKTNKDMKELSKHKKHGKTVDDEIEHIKGDLDNIKKE
jgi:hypothetical protein